jgi:type I restriction enzyme S subunit
MQGRAPEGMDEATAALFPDSFEDSELGAVPKGWPVGSLADLLKLHKGSVNPLIHPDVLFSHYSLPAFDNGQIPVFEYGAEIKSNKTTVPTDAVLVSKLNPHIPRIWLPSVVGSNAVCSTEFLPFIPTSRTTINFVYALLIEPSFMLSMSQLVTGTSNSHQRIKPDSVLSRKHVVPHESCIKKFDEVVWSLMERMKATRQQIQSL